MNLAIKARRVTDAYEVAFDRACTEVTDAILADESIKCGPHRASPKDAAETIVCRADFDAKLIALIQGQITAEQFKSYAMTALYDYASDMAVSLADDKLGEEIDHAEYMQGDR